MDREHNLKNVDVGVLLQGSRFSAPNVRAALSAKRLVTSRDVLSCARSDLLKALAPAGLTAADLAELLVVCSAPFVPPCETPLSLLAAQQQPPDSQRLAWACPVLDAAWGGGVAMGNGVVEFAGEAGSGKTQVALWLACRALARDDTSSVVYVCTEGAFPHKRFRQLSSMMMSKRVVLERAASLDALLAFLETRLPLLLNGTRARLLIIDSVGALRSDYDTHQTPERSQALWKLGQQLKWINDRHQCGVIVTNQVHAVVGSHVADDVVPALGLVWSNCVNTRVMLRKTHRTTGDGAAHHVVRTMTVSLCPYLPRMSLPFVVQTDGVRGVVE